MDNNQSKLNTNIISIYILLYNILKLRCKTQAKIKTLLVKLIKKNTIK